MKKIIVVLIMTLCYSTTFSQDIVSQETGTFKDVRDGKIYKTIKIGNLWIMAENLAYKPSGGQYWAYNNDPENVAKYGYLYDWKTAMNVVPAGWHLPSQDEWNVLYTTLGGNEQQVYSAVIEGGSSGFNAKLSGTCCDDKFSDAGLSSEYWSSSYDSDQDDDLYGMNSAWGFGVYVNKSRAAVGTGDAFCGGSIRLIKD